jgi:hypothetical protein
MPNLQLQNGDAIPGFKDSAAIHTAGHGRQVVKTPSHGSGIDAALEFRNFGSLSARSRSG